ncbi:hypothetical protein HJC23_012118 [Cyclotella cryptica]|uniref:Uncharacterized protein n=1 Tax=Cyclotella cryptica TaxID=29204 RepID=A0ABD3PIF4_9STRA
MNYDLIVNSPATHWTGFQYVDTRLCIKNIKKLGEELPRSFSDDCTEDRIKTTHTMLDEISVTKLLNYRMMTDKKKMMAMKFLHRLASVTHQVHPNLLPVVTLKMVELTIAHGMSSMSPIGFAYLGSLVAKLGDIKGGYKCASLAKSLVDKMNLKEIAGEVYWVSIEILCYIEPLPVANENRIDCEAIALGAGEVTWACYSRLMYASGIFWSGSKLSVSADVYFRGRRFLMSQGHVTTENYLLLLQRSILILIGVDEGEFITDDELKRRVLANNNPFQVTLYYFQKTFAAFILDDYHTMKESAEEYFKSTGKSWLMMSLTLWLEQGTKFKSQMQSWSEKGSSWNFESKYLLLQAEEHFCNDNIDDAKFIYDKAISSAKTHKWVHEEAIAYELAANFYFNLKDYSISLEYFTASHEKYQKWGAVYKVTRLYKCIQEKFATCLGVPKVCVLSSIDGFE